MTTAHSPSRPRPIRTLLAAIGAASLALAAVTAIVAPSGARAEDRVTLDRQHTDVFSVRYENDALALKTRADLDSGAGQILDPGQVRFHVTEEMRDEVPAVPGFAFLGSPGEEIWKISQTYIPGVLWAGWETESLPRGVFAGETIRLRVTDIDGPGDVELYLNDLDGPRRLISSSDTSLRTITENVGAHTHANWVFDAPGTYLFTVVAEADRVSGGVVRSEPRQYEFLVGDPQPSPEPSPSGTESATPTPEPSGSTGPVPSPTASAPPASPSPEPTAPVPPQPTEDPDPGEAPSPEPDDEPAPAPAEDPAIAPTSPLPAPDPSSLVEGNRGGVSISIATVAPGSPVTVSVPAAFAAQWISPWMLSEPTDLGWKQVNAAGGIAITVPQDAPLGEHRMVVRDRTGALIGWTEFSVASAEAAQTECVATPVTVPVSPDNVSVGNDGHFDFGPVKENGTLRALVKDDRTAPAQWVDPGSLVFHLSDAAATQAPGGDFGFLGTGTVWQIPLTQQSGVPWLGWNTQHPSIAGKADGPVTLTLGGVEGPGQLAVYSMDSWGQVGERYFGTADGFPRSTNIEVGASGVHVHGIWAFTQPGAYHVDLTFSGTIDGERASASSTLTFFVGPGDPASAVRAQEATTYVGRTPDGKECELTLAVTGPEDERLAMDLSGLAGTLGLVGIAFLGAAALAPRRSHTRMPS